MAPRLRRSEKGTRREAMVQLAMRVPKALRHELRLHCTAAGAMLQDFIAAAIRERLARLGGRRQKRRAAAPRAAPGEPVRAFHLPPGGSSRGYPPAVDITAGTG